MAKRLKCWKRTLKGLRGTAVREWHNIETSEMVFVHPIYTREGKYFVMSSKRGRAITNNVNKRVAIRRAMSYMKKHDVC